MMLSEYLVLAALVLLFAAVWTPVLLWTHRATREATETCACLVVLQAETLHAHRQLGEVHADLVALRLDHTQQVSTLLTELGRLREAVEAGKRMPVRTGREGE